MLALPAAIDRLAAARRWRYRASDESAAEPAAWAALALAAAGDAASAARPAEWLAGIQQPSGAVGVSASQDDPRWPTSLAMLAWATLDRLAGNARFASCIGAAAQWSLADRGRAARQSEHIGHNTELVGWSWAADTHSWLEPTCMFVLGLRAAGFDRRPRVQEGVRLIVDRLLPDGGANYGNTIVLGRPLVPHLQPTGLAVLTLAGQQQRDARIEKSLNYLARTVSGDTAAASLAFACLGLAAHGRLPLQAAAWIEAALDGERRPPTSEYERALLVLAAQPVDRWLPAASHTHSAATVNEDS
ncbi:MAG: hypothetical protein DCC67_19370 [Planctomycetota bacterium]|nr:MAG: hypothetical protein DCC67_19370 [Planctomycetota bacterium]